MTGPGVLQLCGVDLVADDAAVPFAVAGVNPVPVMRLRLPIVMNNGCPDECGGDRLAGGKFVLLSSKTGLFQLVLHRVRVTSTRRPVRLRAVLSLSLDGGPCTSHEPAPLAIVRGKVHYIWSGGDQITPGVPNLWKLMRICNVAVFAGNASEPFAVAGLQ